MALKFGLHEKTLKTPLDNSSHFTSKLSIICICVDKAISSGIKGVTIPDFTT